MITFIAVGLLLCQSKVQAVDGSPIRPISLNFSQTDVSQIFRAIGLRTNTNIVYSGNDKLPITIHFNALSADEAIRGTSAAAGLTFRKVGSIYVVAKPDAIKLAVAPFANRIRVRTTASFSEITTFLTRAVPDVQITSLTPGHVELVGLPEDLELAKELLGMGQGTGEDRGPVVSETVTLRLSTAAGITSVLQTFCPTVRIIPITGVAKLDVSSAAAQKSAATGNQAKSEGDKSPTGVEDLTKKAADQSNTGETKLGIQQDVKGGVLVLVGREKDVAEAKKRIEELDAAVSSLTNDTFVDTYDTRFASARTILTFLKQAAPEVEVTVAPPTQTPGAFASTLSSGGATHATSGTPGDPAVGSTGGQVKQGTAPDPSGLGRIFDTDPSLGQQYDDSTRLVLKGRKADVMAAIALLKKVDAKPKQVIVEVRIVDATPEAIEHTGLKYSWNQFTFYDSPKGTPVSTATGTTRPVGLGTISRVPVTFNATLDAMVTHSDAKLLANPSMQVLNNQEANFFVGDQLSYPITSGGALGAQNVTVQTYNIGIGLNVRAHVNDDGNVTLRLNPIIQSLTGITNGLPQTSSREANTIVMIKDGESVVIGGLIRDQDTKTVQEIPYLSRLPIVGQLFRHTDRDHLKSNVIVTVTPHIVKDNLEPHP